MDLIATHGWIFSILIVGSSLAGIFLYKRNTKSIERIDAARDNVLLSQYFWQRFPTEEWYFVDQMLARHCKDGANKKPEERRLTVGESCIRGCLEHGGYMDYAWVNKALISAHRPIIMSLPPELQAFYQNTTKEAEEKAYMWLPVESAEVGRLLDLFQKGMITFRFKKQ